MSGQTFAELLKAHRESSYTTQSKLAELAEFDHSYVSRLETGARNPTRDAVGRLAKALNLSPRESDELRMAAGFLGEHPGISPTMLREARSHVASALALLGG